MARLDILTILALLSLSIAGCTQQPADNPDLATITIAPLQANAFVEYSMTGRPASPGNFPSLLAVDSQGQRVFPAEQPVILTSHIHEFRPIYAGAGLENGTAAKIDYAVNGSIIADHGYITKNGGMLWSLGYAEKRLNLEDVEPALTSTARDGRPDTYLASLFSGRTFTEGIVTTPVYSPSLWGGDGKTSRSLEWLAQPTDHGMRFTLDTASLKEPGFSAFEVVFDAGCAFPSNIKARWADTRQVGWSAQRTQCQNGTGPIINITAPDPRVTAPESAAVDIVPGTLPEGAKDIAVADLTIGEAFAAIQADASHQLACDACRLVAIQDHYRTVTNSNLIFTESKTFRGWILQFDTDPPQAWSAVRIGDDINVQEVESVVPTIAGDELQGINITATLPFIASTSEDWRIHWYAFESLGGRPAEQQYYPFEVAYNDEEPGELSFWFPETAWNSAGHIQYYAGPPRDFHVT